MKMPAAKANRLRTLHADLVECRDCPRLVQHRDHIAQVKRAAYRDQTYWGRPVPGFGDSEGPIVIVGLAPGAHGANRTGRMFTGDRSGEFLYAGLHRAGFANQAQSVSRDDELKLNNVFITAPVKCVPPDNFPTPQEISTCRRWLTLELAIVKPKLFLALGTIAWAATLEHLEWERPRPKFRHGAVLIGSVPVVGCFHVSQQNTQTGRLTSKMFDEVMDLVKKLLGDL